MPPKGNKQKTQTIFSTSGTGAMWADEPAPKQPAAEPTVENYTRDEEPRRSYDDDDHRFERRGGRGGGRPYRDGDSYRERDRMLADERRRAEGDDRGHRFTTGGPRRRYDRDDRYHGERPQYAAPDRQFRRAETETKIEPPYIVIVSDLPAGSDELTVGDFFEEKGCKIDEVTSAADGSFELVLVDEQSTRTALNQSKELIKDCAITVRLKPKEGAAEGDTPAYKPPSGASRDIDEPYERHRGGFHSGPRRGRGGFHDRRDGGYDRRDGDYERRDGDYERRDGGYGGRRDGGYGGRRDGGYGGRRDGGYGGRRDGGYGGRRDGGYGGRRDGGFDRRDDRRDGGDEAPADPSAPHQKPQFTVSIDKKTKKENPFGEATPKDIKE